jgi:chloride channel 3/4/5
MDLVYECFVKLGLRYICVLKDGKFAGMVCYIKAFASILQEYQRYGMVLTPPSI